MLGQATGYGQPTDLTLRVKVTYFGNPDARVPVRLDGKVKPEWQLDVPVTRTTDEAGEATFVVKALPLGVKMTVTADTSGGPVSHSFIHDRERRGFTLDWSGEPKVSSGPMPPAPPIPKEEPKVTPIPKEVTPTPAKVVRRIPPTPDYITPVLILGGVIVGIAVILYLKSQGIVYGAVEGLGLIGKEHASRRR